MSHQSEAMLEEELIKQLEGQDYEYVDVKNMEQLENNLKLQLEYLNKTKFSTSEFNRILLHLDGGTIFDKALRLRDRFELTRDDNTVFYVKFIDKRWCKNTFQVANQIEVQGIYSNRYDVTILINGLPLVQIELKRRGIELKQAFNQTQRYQRQSYNVPIFDQDMSYQPKTVVKKAYRGLFGYIQIFVISNGVDTKYYANNKNLNYKFTFFWKDETNRNITNIQEFTTLFLDRYQLHKMIYKYMVLSKSNETLTILRAYQQYAVEAILEKALHSKENGYIWHTTGSGKTLTSFKTSQLLAQKEDIDKVIFVVDRRDLDNQTLDEFNKFGNNSIDGTNNTRKLVKQLLGTDKLIVTTIQKLSIAVNRNSKQLEKIKNNKIVLMFDECHRSQFGQMHSDITSFFNNLQYYGFTGTPILQENAKNKTTHDLFGKCLHKYLIVDAIADENVLGFSVDYIGKYKNLAEDILVEDIDSKEVLESEKRISKIVDYIIDVHNKKTYDKEFTSILAVSSIDALQVYYDMFKKKEHDLKIATIYSFEQNPDMDDENKIPPREALESQINDYNQLFGTSFSTDTFQMYYQDVSKKSKERKIDILLVVNMFLTGFDNKYLNTLYVDKNLEYHGLLQAYSRTNRLCNEKKSYGNIVVFRKLKKQTDDAIRLFSDENALDYVLMGSYEDYVKDFNEEVKKFNEIVHNIEELNDDKDIEKQAEFVKSFRNMLRIVNKLKTFTEFEFDDLDIPEQDFEDYKSKYLDLHEKTQNPLEKTSILDDIDFETELLRRDDINVEYIMNLLKDLNPKEPNFEKEKQYILDLMDKDTDLRSKLDLVEKFINENMIDSNDNTEEKFAQFIENEKHQAITNLVEEENLKEKELRGIIQEYEFSGKIKPQQIRESFNQKLKLKDKITKTKSLTQRIKDIIDKFTW